MAYLIYAWSVPTPPGTPADTPQTIDLAFPPGKLDSIQVKVPPGPQGQLGFAIAMAGQPVIPTNPGEWVITDDEEISWELAGLPDSGAWQLLTYNTGYYPHSLFVRFLITPAPLVEQAPAAAAPLPPTDLSNVPAQLVTPTSPALSGIPDDLAAELAPLLTPVSLGQV